MSTAEPQEESGTAESRFCEESCPTRFIPDEPSDKDALTKGNIPGPHERVAIALAEMIHHDAGGKMVGIEGAWGSGKSTVISLLRKKLRGEDDPIPWRRNPDIESEVFCFDVWAHEGDPLRRTFFESLARALFEEWVDKNSEVETKKTWQNLLDEVSGRRKVERVDSTSGLTLFGKVTALAVLLAPLGTSLLSGAAGEGLAPPWTGSWDWQSSLGVGLLAGPLVAILFAGIFTFVKTGDLKFLSSKKTNTTTTVALRTLDPTSIEFEDYFRKLVKSAVANHPERRLVLVIDNLDRVEPDDARRIWSTLQVFLGDPAARKESWFKQVWFLVPFDPDGLTALWSDTAKREPQGKASRSRNDNPEVGVRESFLDKSFQLRFEVPPAALSDWQGHLRGLIRTALPHHSSDAHDVSRVVAHCLKKRDETPTLRALTNIVNQIGVVHRQWPNAFDLRHVAYYVMLRRYQVDVVKGLRDGELLDEEIVEVLEGDSTSTLAALAFNLPPIQALQVLLAGPIRKALSENKPEALTKLLTDHEDGFWAVLEHSARDLVAAEAPELARTALCLQGALSDHESHNALKSFRSALVSAVFKTEAWSPMNEELAKGTVALCLNFAGVGGLGVWMSIHKKLSEWITKSGLGNPEKEAPEAIKFLRLLASKMPDRIKNVRFELNQREDYWRTLCPVLANDDKDGAVTSLLEPLCVKEFREGLINRINNGDEKPELPTLVEVSLRSAGDFKLEGLLQPIAGRFAVATQRPHPECTDLLKTLAEMRKHRVPGIEQALQTLANQAGVAHWVAQEWGQPGVQSYGSAFLIVLRPVLQSYEGNPQKLGNSQQGLDRVTVLLKKDSPNTAPKLLEALKAFDGLDAIPSSPQLQGSPVLLEVLKTLAEKEPTAISATAIYRNWQNVRTLLVNANAQKSWKDFCNAHGQSWIENLVGEQPSAATEVLANDLIEFIDDPRLNQWCISLLKNANSNEWFRALQSENPLVSMLTHLETRGQRVELGVPLKDALLQAATRTVTGSKLENLDNLKEELARRLPESYRQSLDKDIAKLACSHAESLNEAFVSAFGSVMIQYAEQNSEAIIAELFDGIVNSRPEPGLQWLAEFAEAHPDFLDDHPRAFEFKERVQIARRELDSPEFKRIARAWRIEPLKTHEVIDTKE